MKPVFGGLHHLRMRLQPDKIRKIGDKKFSVFTAGSIFWPIHEFKVINEHLTFLTLVQKVKIS